MAANDDEYERDLADRGSLSDLADGESSTATLVNSYYRAEVDRMTAWRSRLDQTTNWAVVLVAAILTWAFSSEQNPHYVILIGVFGVVAFLLIEAHRYMEYDVWRMRVRSLQKHVFAPAFSGERPPDDDWRSRLGDSLAGPTYTMSFRKAVGHRLRRTYMALLLIMLAAWVARITVFEADETWRQSASIPGVGGEVVVAVVFGVYLVLAAVAVWSARGAEVREFEG